MAINPYGLVGGQQSVLQNLLKSQQMEKDVGQQTGMQMGSMRREFQSESQRAMDEVEALMAQQFQQSKSDKDKGGLFSGVSSLLSAFLPGVGSALGALFTGASSYEQMKKQKSHQINKILAAQAASKINQKRWGKTFLGERAQDFESTMEKQLSAEMQSTKDMFGSKSDMRTSALKAGLQSGLTSLAMGQAMKGFGKGIKKRIDFKKGLPKGTTMKDVRLGKKAIKKELGLSGKEFEKFTKELSGLDEGMASEIKDVILDPSTASGFDIKHAQGLGLSDKALASLGSISDEDLKLLFDTGGPIKGIVEQMAARPESAFSSDKAQTFLETYLTAMQGAGGAAGLHDLYEKQ